MNNDQAENLRKLVENESKCKSLFFMSGKEKVGQTVLITNLATFLSENDYKTLIIDSGSGFFRTDVLLNVFSKYGSVKAIENSESLDDLMVSINDNLENIYMRPVFEKVKSSKELLTSLEGYLDDFKEKYDFILIDLEDSDIESIKILFDYRTKLIFTLDSGDLEELKTTYCIIKDIEKRCQKISKSVFYWEGFCMVDAPKTKESNKQISKKSKSTRKSRERLQGYGFVTPTVIIMGTFVLSSVLYSIFISFTRVNLLGEISYKFVGLENYINLFKDQRIWIAFKNTFKYVICVVPIQTFGALVLAYVLNQKLKARNLIRTVLFLPTLTSSAVLTMILILMLI